jgi:site-specific DNA-methyltransferase (adenine-specific)
VAAMLDEQIGERETGTGDTGGVSRFFYCAKACRSEREAGLREAGLRETGQRRTLGDFPNHPSKFKPGAADVANLHPTVKPISLMRCRRYRGFRIYWH